MNFIELQVTFSLFVVFLFRMLGMFMVLPVLSEYGMSFKDGSHFLVGLSIGIYGITQVIFQVPYGILSDKFGRKRLIILGLLMFLIGSFIAADTDSIWGIIVGRAIQGSGAISGVLMALLSDLIREEHRVKAISAIGASFALSFLFSIVSGPLVFEYFGFFSIFWISVFFSVLCIFTVIFFIPESKNIELQKNQYCSSKKSSIFFVRSKIFRCYLGIFCLHCLLMINFMIIPHQLILSGLSLNNHWKVYLSIIASSFIFLFFVVFFLKSKRILKNIIEICIFFIFCSFFILHACNKNLFVLICSLQLFFIAFNLLEVFFPSFLNKEAPISSRGRVMSIYSTSQFLGVFFGGVLSGWLCSFFDVSEIFLLETLFVLFWLMVSFFS
ncbi:MFS transporter [Buchnera aphidicola (Muscaphis stroyani)]|uniref:MFS transporter n=2 Tax=Buchnera aphidicola TaxID=9 RepID=A0A4D6YJE8_9GAMM|nr:MFS transporter [Buchnera aphidicola (Muscaphis stroyani)]